VAYALDRQSVFLIVVAVCIVNGIFSPYLNIAIPITAVLLPEAFPRTYQWVLFFSSVMVSTATLLFSGVPAALYERLMERDPASPVSSWIWLAGALLLSLPAVANITRL
jgi:heme/copper-type cytochrome/quinol oxidase subunit 3